MAADTLQPENLVRQGWQHLTKDARHYQITFLLVFLLYGIFLLDWDTNFLNYLILIISCLLVQYFSVTLTGADLSSLKSALISAFSLCLMFKANSTETYILAATLSIGSKFLIRHNGKHIFNPTNFGIITAIIFTGDGWISPGQWGSNGQLIFLIGIAGLTVLLRAKRLDTAFAFLVAFLGSGFLRNILYLGWPVDFFYHQLSSGTLLLFTFFMITDPKSSPNNRSARILWAAAIGIGAFVTANTFLLHAAPVWWLFFLSPLSPLLDKLFVSKQFNWN